MKAGRMHNMHTLDVAEGSVCFRRHGRPCVSASRHQAATNTWFSDNVFQTRVPQFLAASVHTSTALEQAVTVMVSSCEFICSFSKRCLKIFFRFYIKCEPLGVALKYIYE